MKEILALIPARSGSKSVVDKNIRMIGGKPMLAHSIDHAKASKYITRTIVSTDSEKYAAIAREYGAQTPFIRPAEYATDTALDIDVFEHALNFLKENEGYEPELVVQLRPTYPIRRVDDIDGMIEIMLSDETIDSMRCITAADEIPYKMWRIGSMIGPDTAGAGENSRGKEYAIIDPLMTDISECYNMPRQQLPRVYYQNACIDVIRTRVITDMHSMSGRKIAGYIMHEYFDIDTEEEFKKAEEEIGKLKSPKL